MDIEFSEKEAVAIIEAENGLRVYAFSDGNFTSNKLIPNIEIFRRYFEFWGNHPHVPKNDALQIALCAIPEYFTQEIKTIRREEKPFTDDDKIIY